MNLQLRSENNPEVHSATPLSPANGEGDRAIPPDDASFELIHFFSDDAFCFLRRFRGHCGLLRVERLSDH